MSRRSERLRIASSWCANTDRPRDRLLHGSQPSGAGDGDVDRASPQALVHAIQKSHDALAVFECAPRKPPRRLVARLPLARAEVAHCAIDASSAG